MASPQPRSQPRRAAGLHLRLLAMLYDSFVWFAISVAAVGLLLAAAAAMGHPARADFGVLLPGWLVAAAVLAANGGIYVWCMAASGQTLGMRPWRLRLVRADGTAAGWRAALLRFALAWPALALCGLGHISCLWHPAGDSWLDRRSKTRVLSLRP